MEKIGTIVIETNRLVLGRYKMDDAKIVHEHLRGDERIVPYVLWNVSKSLSETTVIMEKWMIEYQDPFKFRWKITDKEDKKFIGNFGVGGFNDGTAMIGYELAFDEWGKGYAIEAANGVLKFMFNEVKVKSLIGEVDQRNNASRKLLIRLGMKFKESKLDKDNQGNPCMVDYYEITSDVYFKSLKMQDD